MINYDNQLSLYLVQHLRTICYRIKIRQVISDLFDRAQSFRYCLVAAELLSIVCRYSPYHPFVWGEQGYGSPCQPARILPVLQYLHEQHVSATMVSISKSPNRFPSASGGRRCMLTLSGIVTLFPTGLRRCFRRCLQCL